MRRFVLQDAQIEDAAHGRISSLRWRLALGVIFGVSGAAALNAPLIGLAWYALLLAGMLADYALAKRLVAMPSGPARSRQGLIFIVVCIVTNLFFNSLTVASGLLGGDAGRAASFVVAAASVMT